MGDRFFYVERAGRLIDREIGAIVRSSSIYESEPWGFEDDQNFLNKVVEVDSDLQPTELLTKIHKIESELGRIRTGAGYEARTIDIDILFYGNWIIIQNDLVIPHKHLPGRRFALTPLAELVPELYHPVLACKVQSILDRCKDKGEVKVVHATRLAAH